MPAKANATWTGGLKGGNGKMKVGSGAFDVPFSFGTRFEGTPGTNPEELIGAALAGCFSMALSAGLEGAGHKPNKIETSAEVTLSKVEGGFAITTIKLVNVSEIPAITEQEFQTIAEATKKGCPVSKVLTGAKIELQASLKQ